MSQDLDEAVGVGNHSPTQLKADFVSVDRGLHDCLLDVAREAILVADPLTQAHLVLALRNLEAKIDALNEGQGNKKVG